MLKHQNGQVVLMLTGLPNLAITSSWLIQADAPSFDPTRQKLGQCLDPIADLADRAFVASPDLRSTFLPSSVRLDKPVEFRTLVQPSIYHAFIRSRKTPLMKKSGESDPPCEFEEMRCFCFVSW